MASKSIETAIGRRQVDVAPAPQPAYPGDERRTGEVRRGGPRARALLTGKIVIGEGDVSYDCVVRNLSAKGARVRVAGVVSLPDAFGLLVVKEGLLFDAAIAWRRGDQIGLNFSGQHDLRGEVDAAHRGVRALWTALAPL